MRNLSVFILIALICLIISSELNAQAKVTGHATAEIIETAGFRSSANSQFALSAELQQTSISIGDYSVSGGAFTAGAIVFSCSDLYSEGGNTVKFIAETSLSGSVPVLSDGGKETISLTGNVDESLFLMTDKMYTGQYQIVFAYN